MLAIYLMSYFLLRMSDLGSVMSRYSYFPFSRYFYYLVCLP